MGRSMPLWIGAFPEQAAFSSKYVDTFRITTTAGSLAYQSYRLNSLFDPDYTNTGHQPLGFDQVSSLYNQYKVLRVRARCTLTIDPALSASGNVQVVITRSSSGAPLTVADATTNAEQNGGAIMVIQNNTSSPYTYTRTVDIPSWQGVSRDVYIQDASYDVATNTNPSDVIYLSFILTSQDGSTTLNLNGVVTLNFEYVMRNRKSLTQS